MPETSNNPHNVPSSGLPEWTRPYEEAAREREESQGRDRARTRVRELEEAFQRSGRDYASQDQFMRNLFQAFLSEQTQSGKAVFEEALQRTEADMRTRWSREMPDILRARITLMRQMNERRGTTDARRILEGLSRFNIDTSAFRTVNNALCVDGPHDSVWTVSISADETVVFRERTRPSAMAALPIREFMNTMEAGSLRTVLQTALDNGRNEEQGTRRLESFDLPPDGNIAHVRLFSRDPGGARDLMAQSQISTTAFLSSALRHRYGNRLYPVPVAFTDDPKSYLRQLVARASEKGGVRTFVIDIFEHGDRERIRFRQPLTAADLADIAREFPECHFVINTIACHGGGLQPGFDRVFRDQPELARRMSVFLQTKHSMENTVGRFEGEREVTNWSTMYNAYFAQALYEGRTYGQAAVYADRMTKAHSWLDPEAIIDGQLISGLSSSGSDVA